MKGQLPPAYIELKRKCDQSHIPVALRPDAERLEVQVGRPGLARPRFLEEPPPARLDRYIAGNAIRCVAKRKEDRRL